VVGGGLSATLLSQLSGLKLNVADLLKKTFVCFEPLDISFVAFMSSSSLLAWYGHLPCDSALHEI
jgi:hypothetical protein